MGFSPQHWSFKNAPPSHSSFSYGHSSWPLLISMFSSKPLPFRCFPFDTTLLQTPLLWISLHIPSSIYNPSPPPPPPCGFVSSLILTPMMLFTITFIPTDLHPLGILNLPSLMPQISSYLTPYMHSTRLPGLQMFSRKSPLMSWPSPFLLFSLTAIWRIGH